MSTAGATVPPIFKIDKSSKEKEPTKYDEYRRQQREEEWLRATEKKKKELTRSGGNRKLLDTAADYKAWGSGKLKVGNLLEACDYYREAYFFVWDVAISG